jgi:hypothetical protein
VRRLPRSRDDPMADDDFVGPLQQDSYGTDPTSTDPSNTQKALALLAGIAPGLLARAFSPGADANVPPELRQLLAQQTQRSAYQNPLFEAVTGQALAGLPEYAKAGHTLGPSMGTSVPQVSASGGGMNPAAKAALAGIPLGALLAALKKLFGNQSSQSQQPNQPNQPRRPNRPGQPNWDAWGRDPNQWDPDWPNTDVNWDQWGRDPNQWDPYLPQPNVDTDQWLGQWPETYGSGGTPDLDPGLFTNYGSDDLW